MIKKVFCTALVAIGLTILGMDNTTYAWGTNRPLKARIQLGDKVIEGMVDEWHLDNSDSGLIFLRINEKKHFVHISNVIIWEE